MGKVRTVGIKRIANEIIETYPTVFTSDFEKNKEIFRNNQIAKVPTKRLRNKILGYVTHLIKLREIEEGSYSLPSEEEETKE